MFKGLNKKNAQAIIIWALWNNIEMITRVVALQPWSCESVDFENSGRSREPHASLILRVMVQIGL
jgi:hypothetical protein